jgi:predicted amidohydrolase
MNQSRNQISHPKPGTALRQRDRVGSGGCATRRRSHLPRLAVCILAVLGGADSAPAQIQPLTNSTVRVAGIVLKWVRGDKEANLRRAEPMIREAAKGGARIVVTTECFLDGYAIQDKSIPLEEYRALGELIPDGRHFQRLTALARELKIHLVAGLTEADGDLRYNTAVLIGPDGRLVGKYRKHALEHELVRNTPGTNTPAFKTDFCRLGMMICADRKHPDLVARIVAEGAEFLLCPSGGMFGPQRNDHYLQERSKENGVYIVFVHPCEFLVTAPDGTIRTTTLLGDKLLVSPAQIGTELDSKRVFYFDLPVGPG